MKKKLLLIASVLLMSLVWTGVQFASSSSNNAEMIGVYYGDDICCCWYEFKARDSQAKASAAEDCKSCNDGKACKYKEADDAKGAIATPACLCSKEGNTNPTSEESRPTESNSNQSGGVSFENDAECPAPDCRYESNGRGGRTCRCEVKLERKPSKSNDFEKNSRSTTKSENRSLAEKYFFIGQDYYANQDYDNAILNLTKAIEADATYENPYFFRGYAYYYKEKYDLAIADFTKAIEINPKDSGYYFGRADAYEKKGEPAKAVSDYQKAYQLKKP